MNKLMDYESYDKRRYHPDAATAIHEGMREFRNLASTIGSNRQQRILEIGCGGGRLLSALKSQGYVNCRGIDLDERLVEHGRNALRIDVVREEWRQYLAATTECFDCIIAMDVLEHLPREELAETLRATRQRIAPGGKLIVRVPNPLCPFGPSIFYGDLTHQSFVTPRLLLHMLRMAGFTGNIVIGDVLLSSGWKRWLFASVHYLLVRPLSQISYFCFCGSLPEAVTANFAVVANAD